MIIKMPARCGFKYKEGDIIALTRDDKFIGYGELMAIYPDCVLLKTGKMTERTFNELLYENIPFNFDLM